MDGALSRGRQENTQREKARGTEFVCKTNFHAYSSCAPMWIDNAQTVYDNEKYKKMFLFRMAESK